MTGPKRSLGQNFLVEPAISRRIVEASGASAGEPLLEIGPGRGALTGLLAELGQPLVLLEKDDGLADNLEVRFADSPQVVLVRGDAMRVDLDGLPLPGIGERRIRAVANLPYNVASRIALRMLAWGGLRDATFTFQREVAIRFAASPGNRDYGALTVMARVYADPFLLFPIPPAAFRPRPRVDSHVVRFRLLDEPRIGPAELPHFEAVVRGVFQTRRKTLANAVRRVAGEARSAEQLAAVLADCELDPRCRPETLTFDQFVTLARRLGR
jgi:16S rRNA (adenine1518-N6/adenine1519-N6)-dimethyltransferase